MRTGVTIWTFIKTVVREFLHDHGPLMAAAMSFYATLSFFPLLLVGVAALGYGVGKGRAFQDVMDYVQVYSPGPVVRVVSETLSVIVNTRKAAGLIGLGVLIWPATSVFLSLETAMCMTWSVNKRPLWKSFLVAFSMLLLVGSGLLVVLGFTAISVELRDLRLFGHALPEVNHAWRLMGYVVPLILGTVIFACVYWTLPNVQVHARAAVLGGVCGAAVWQAALEVFRVYLSHFAHFDVIYGSVAGAIVLLLWIYYTNIVVLLGAEIAWQCDQRLRAKEGKAAETPREKLSTPTPIPRGW